MDIRPLWQKRITDSWTKAPICWLSGVRRVGKTTLAKSLPDALLVNCDLPDAARQLADPVRFFQGVTQPRLILDEVHQLEDPSRVLKIAADEFPKLQVLATGSSTLAATEKFSDSLTGRKRTVHLVPVLPEELPGFGTPGLDRRMLHGGLPPALLAQEPDPGFYAEWLDSYFARDVQELFRIGKRTEFLLLVEILLRQSGGILEATSLAKAAGLSRATVLSYLGTLETTHVLTLVRPWSGGKSDRELVQAPKGYCFDTGFVCHARSIQALRPDDRGMLLEHLALESMQAVRDLPRIHYWRTKDRREEIDFVIPRGESCDTLEVKWDAGAFDPKNLKAFRALYPKGRNIVVSAQTAAPYERSVAGMEVEFMGIEALRGALSATRGSPA